MAASFFFFPGSYLSPFRQFLWWLDAGAPPRVFPASYLAVGFALVFLYPYLWALGRGVAALAGSRNLARTVDLALHGAGAAVMLALSLVMIVYRDGFVALPVLIGVGALAPILFLLTAAAWRRVPGNAGFLTGPGWMGLFLLLQLGVARAVSGEGEPGWGYLLGALGSADVVAGGCLFWKRGGR